MADEIARQLAELQYRKVVLYIMTDNGYTAHLTSNFSLSLEALYGFDIDMMDYVEIPLSTIIRIWKDTIH